MFETQHNSKGTDAYATAQDFCRIFKQDMKNLYYLALLLTADPAGAEQCFVSGLEDCAGTNRVFKEWAGSWARRMIIKNAIRLLAPEAVNGNGSSNLVSNRGQNGAGNQAPETLQAEISALLDLEPFERFAFVMSILEGYSDRECALLLGCTRESLIAARVRALQQIGQSMKVHNATQAAAVHQNRNSILKLVIPAPLATTA